MKGIVEVISLILYQNHRPQALLLIVMMLAKFLRDGAEVLPLSLGNIINLSIKLLTFPEEYKIAKLNPTFKNRARTDAKNYRPIFLLPLASKILEKSIHFQIEDYLKKKKLIYMCQSGFRTNHSTDFCVAQLIDFVTTGMAKQIHTSMMIVNHFLNF